MRSLSALGLTACLTLVGLSACADDAGTSGPTASGSGEASTTVAPTAPTTTTTTTSTTTTTTTTTTSTVAPPLVRDGTARALITTTGVVVPAFGRLPEGYLVRTPCRQPAVVVDGTPVDRVHVVLDPGHGGSEPGAVVDGLTEASLNLAVARAAEERLSALGFEVLLTRYGDERVPILTRVEIADRLGADLLISIHHQGGGEVPPATLPGTEVYYQRESAESRRLAGLLREEAVEQLGSFAVDGWFAGPDAGATYRLDSDTGTDFYGMVRRPVTTAVLAEMSFMGNPAELSLLRTPEFLEAEAAVVADAVARWFSTDDEGSGFVEPSFTLRSSGGGGGLAGCIDPDLGTTVPVPEGIEDELGDP